MNLETLELAQLMEKWHKSKVDQLDLVIEKKDADIVIGDHNVKAGTDLHKGIVMGFMLAKETFGDLPFSLEAN